MQDLEQSARRFGVAFSSAMITAVQRGNNFEATLKSIARSMSSMALRAGLKPLEQLTGNLIGSLVQSLSGSLGAGIANTKQMFGMKPLPSLSGGPSYAPGVHNSPLNTSPVRNPLAGWAPNSTNVTFNVTTPDATSFQKSEAQIGSMLARSMSRARRMG